MLEKYDTKVYKIHSLFIPQPGGNTTAIEMKHQYMAVNQQKKFYAFLTINDLDKCIRGVYHKIYDIHAAFLSSKENQSCEYLLKNRLNEYSIKKCRIIMKQNHENMFIPL